MTQRVGVRELREKLASFLELTEPIEVTRHGETIGFFIPIPRRPGQAEREALLEAGKRMDAELIRLGLKEDELLEEFKEWRRQRDHATETFGHRCQYPDSCRSWCSCPRAD